MLTTDVTHPGTATLADLEQFANQQEAVLGPLVNLGNAGPNSVLTFDMSDPPPAQSVILRLTIGGATPVVPGFTLSCQGNCLIGSQLAGVAALRATVGRSATPTVDPGSALHQAVTGELPAASAFKPVILQAAQAHNLPAAVIAGIGSVESAWGTSTLMQPNGPTGTGDRAPRRPLPPLRPGSMPPDGLGFGRGLMQIDWDSHDFARTGNWRDANANIVFGAALLAADRDQFAAGGMPQGDALNAAIAAYNAGFDGASEQIRQMGLAAVIGPGTYAGSVLTRASFFRANGFA